MNEASPSATGDTLRSGPSATVEARKLSAAAPTRGPGTEFSYTVLGNAEPGPLKGERRSVMRQRTRLRSGKLVHPAGHFITECLIHNRSASGCRLRLSVTVALPPSVYFFDDQSERLFQAVVTWQKDRNVGIRLLPHAVNGLNRAIAERMRRKFYVMPR